MDNAKKIELTAEGRQKLVEELAYREGEKHDEIVERIKEALATSRRTPSTTPPRRSSPRTSPASTRFARSSPWPRSWRAAATR